ncbi:ankyrin repeat domain-containing protein [Candidatus Babeliales bacterium]|nr:ankyrin repeat domain-containing protein [Candidatus Babeliales bacterium]
MKKLFLLLFLFFCKADVFSISWNYSIPNSLEKKNEQLKKACGKSNFKRIKLLVEAGAEVNSNPILYYVIHKYSYFSGFSFKFDDNNIKIIKYLIEQNTNTNSLENGNSLLFIAYKNNAPREFLCYLIKATTDIKVDGHKCLNLAINNENIDDVKYFLKSGADVNNGNSLHEACKKNNIEILKILLESGGELNCSNSIFETTLHIACKYSNYDIIKLLIISGARINVINFNESSPLHYACYRDHVAIVRLLLQAGANPNIKNLNQKTPLNISWFMKTPPSYSFYDHSKSQEKRFKDRAIIIEELVNAGADVNTEDCYGNTPLQRAYWYDSIQIFDYLVKAGAKVDKNTDKKLKCLVKRDKHRQMFNSYYRESVLYSSLILSIDPLLQEVVLDGLPGLEIPGKEIIEYLDRLRLNA